MLTEKVRQYVNEKIRPFIDIEQDVFMEMGEKDCNEYLRLMQKYITICAYLQCGHCESRCPFHVKQENRMKEIAEYFGD